jgi:hypothetical protein
LRARTGAWFSFFLQLLLFIFSLGFLLQWRLSWIFVTPTVGAGKEAYHPLFLYVQCPKWPLVITLKVSGLFNCLGRRKGFIRPSPHNPNEKDSQHSSIWLVWGGMSMPATLQHTSSFSRGNILVIISEPFLSVWILSSCTNLELTTCRIQWYLTSICLVQEWKLGFLARWIALWLSQNRLYFSYFMPNSCKKFRVLPCRHQPLLCTQHLWLTMKHIYPEVNFLEFASV